MTVASRMKVGSFSGDVVSGALAAPANEWLVTLADDVADLDAAADALAARYEFAVNARLCVVRSFVATMPKASVTKLHSEPSVTRILLNRRRRAIAA